MTQLVTILKYNVDDTAGVVGQQPFKTKAKFATLSNWTLVNQLNKLIKFEVNIPNDEYAQANIQMERSIFLPFLTPIRGMICGRAETPNNMTVQVCEKAFHLTRRVFSHDSEKKINFTDEKWYNTSWAYRRLIIVNPDDVETAQSSITLRINVATNAGFAAHALANGFDFRVTKKDGTTLVNHERITWTPATGELDLYFEAATVSNSGSTKFYIYYGNAAASDGSTNITDVDPSIPLTLHPQEQYKLAANLIAQQILDSANTDMPAGVTWTLDPNDFPTDVITLSLPLKNHFDALHLIGESLGKDVWFDNKSYIVYMGTKGKTITEELDITITSNPELSVDNFANEINLIGKKDSGTDLQISEDITTATNLRFNYEKVVTNNQLTDASQLTSVATNLLDEFKKLTPTIKGEVPFNQFERNNLQSGDVIPIYQPDKQLKGNFRIMDIHASPGSVKLSLESTDTGVIRLRSVSLTGVIEGILKKLQNQSIES